MIDLVAGAGGRLDTVVLPKVAGAGHVQALDLLLTQLERLHGLPVGRIGIEALIEDAGALTRADEIAAASPRLEALHVGPGDLMASLGLASLSVGALPDGLSAAQRQALPVTSLPDNWEATGRNSPCPCGSGKKFKHCHGALV